MHTQIVKLALVISPLILLAACRPSPPAVDSGIAKTLDEARWFESTNADYRAFFHHSTGDDCGKTLAGIETQRRFVITFNSGSLGDLVSKFRDEVKKVIERSGAVIWDSGSDSVPTSADLRDFSYDYIWHNNVGVIRVHSILTATNAVTVILFCYEHRR
jgi:hypothetical protein